MDGECPVLFAEWLRWSTADLDNDPLNLTKPGMMTFTKRYQPGSVATIPPGPEPEFPTSLDLDNYAYRIRLRAEYSTMRNVVIRAYDSTHNQVDLPGRVEIEAWGRYFDTHQRIVVKVPRKVPLSALFDFAVFSECSLVKGYSISCP